MFPFDADCSYCRHLDPNDQLKGKFYCKKKKEYVSARASLCREAAEVMGRPNCDKERLRQISKDHGYYVITAITGILDLPGDNPYMDTFRYLRDVVLPSNEKYKEFIDDYEKDGPALADLIRKDDNSQEYAEYLRCAYLNGLVSLFCQDRIDDAITLYTSMLDAIKEKYGYRRADVKAKEIMHFYNGCVLL